MIADRRGYLTDWRRNACGNLWSKELAMPETVACPCTIHDPEHPEAPKRIILNWNGSPDTVRALGVPARLHPGESVTVPAITLAPLADPVRVTYEASEDLTITWLTADVAHGAAILDPDPMGERTWEARFSLAGMSLARPRQLHVRLVLERMKLPPWFVSAATALSVTAGLGFAASLGCLLAGTGAWVVPVAILCAGIAIASYPPALRRFRGRFGLPLPLRGEPIGSIPLPAIEMEPVIRRSETMGHPLVVRYNERLAKERVRLEVLGLASPINLDEAYVPIPLRMRRGAEVEAAPTYRAFSQVDELIEADQSLKRLLAGELLSPEDAWHRHTRLTIIGDVGTGKTTILHRLSINLARGPVLWTAAVPVIIELHTFARRPEIVEQPVESVKRAVAETIVGEGANQKDEADARAAVEELVEGGELALFFDALDEVSGPGDEQERLVVAVISAICAVAEQWPLVRMTVTCRRASMDRYRRLPDSFVLAETLPFGADDIRRFVTRYFAGSPDRATRLLDEMERNPRVRAMATTPLLLALLTLIFEQRGSLPHRKAEIYRRCADLLLREWDAQRHRDRYPRFLVEHKEELLRSVAWQLHGDGVRHVERGRLVGLLRTVLPSVGLQPDAAADLLGEIAAHHGLLRPYGSEWYGFVHFAMQEYFASECIEQRAPLAVAIEHRHRAWWQEVIRLYAGRGDCTDLIVSLLRQPEDLFRTNLRLAGECLAQGTAVDPELRGHVLSELHTVARSLRVPKLDARFWLVLTRAGGGDYASDLWQALSDGDLSVDVRTTIVQEMPGALGELFGGTAVERLADEKLPAAVRVAIAEALGGCGFTQLCGTLLKMVRSPSQNEDVRAALVREVARVGITEHAGVLRELMFDPAASTRMRRECAAALRTLGATGIVPHLIEKAGDWHLEPPVRSSFASAVGEVWEEGDVGETIRALSNARLPSAIRTSLAASLKRVESPALVDALIVLLKDLTVDYGVRLGISDVLCSVGMDVHRNAIRAVYTDRRMEEPIRTRLAVALGILGETDVLPLLVRLLEDRSARPYIRLEAARILGSATDGGMLDIIVGMLDARTVDPLGQELAVLVLNLRDEPDAAMPLVDRLGDRRLPLRVRMRMADAVATLGSSDHIDRLVSLLADRSLTVELRGRLALAIMRMTDSRNRPTFERLAELMSSADDVPEVSTLLWHLSEQVGVPVYPSDELKASVAYPWLEPWVQREKDT